jgi:hypothetical protein
MNISWAFVQFPSESDIHHAALVKTKSTNLAPSSVLQKSDDIFCTLYWLNHLRNRPRFSKNQRAEKQRAETASKTFAHEAENL